METSLTKFWPRVLLFVLLGVVVSAAHAGAAMIGQISDSDKYAWSEGSGWQNCQPAVGGVTIHDHHLSGYVWAAGVGWIKLGAAGGGPYANTSATNWGVNRDAATGALSGYAWSETVGWINFHSGFNQVFIDPVSRDFSGYAWSGAIGYIHFQSTTAPAYKVQAITIPASPAIVSATAANGQATVVFTPPATDGGSAISAYTVTANPGGLVAIGSQSPITVTGLSNGQAYTVTVTATNAIGP